MGREKRNEERKEEEGKGRGEKKEGRKGNYYKRNEKERRGKRKRKERKGKNCMKPGMCTGCAVAFQLAFKNKLGKILRKNEIGLRKK